VLTSAEAVERWQLPIRARLHDAVWAGLDPREMSLGPVHAMAPLLTRHGLHSADIDYWEINEAFAAQVLACLRARTDADDCRRVLGLPQGMDPIDPVRINVDGGAIAIGHPVGASGARIVLHLLQVLQRNDARRGVASLCIGGGQGGAMLSLREVLSVHAPSIGPVTLRSASRG
jgi:acetyl-CoA C-acetyltransferase